MKNKHKMFRLTKEKLKEELRLEKAKYINFEREMSRLALILALIAVVLVCIYANKNGVSKKSIGYNNNDTINSELNIDM